jgi:hypothetical protein
MRTPETLRQAIQNGIEQGIILACESKTSPPKAADVIERHVLDFLRQKFGALYLIIEAGPITAQTVMDRLRETARQIGIERR